MSNRPNSLAVSDVLGSKTYRLASAATTNSNLIKAGPTRVEGYVIINTNAAARFVKLYNKATAPTVGTDTPLLTIQVPATSMVVFDFTPGQQYDNGLGIGTTTGAAASDAVAVGANDLIIHILYG